MDFVRLRAQHCTCIVLKSHSCFLVLVLVCSRAKQLFTNGAKRLLKIVSSFRRLSFRLLPQLLNESSKCFVSIYNILYITIYIHIHMYIFLLYHQSRCHLLKLLFLVRKVTLSKLNFKRNSPIRKAFKELPFLERDLLYIMVIFRYFFPTHPFSLNRSSFGQKQPHIHVCLCLHLRDYTYDSLCVREFSFAFGVNKHSWYSGQEKQLKVKLRNLV